MVAKIRFLRSPAWSAFGILLSFGFFVLNWFFLKGPTLWVLGFLQLSY